MSMMDVKVSSGRICFHTLARRVKKVPLARCIEQKYEQKRAELSLVESTTPKVNKTRPKRQTVRQFDCRKSQKRLSVPEEVGICAAGADTRSRSLGMQKITVLARRPLACLVAN